MHPWIWLAPRLQLQPHDIRLHHQLQTSFYQTKLRALVTHSKYAFRLLHTTASLVQSAPDSMGTLHRSPAWYSTARCELCHVPRLRANLNIGTSHLQIIANMYLAS